MENQLQGEKSRWWPVVLVLWKRAVTPKRARSRHEDGAGGDHDTPLLFPPCCPAGVTERVG